MVGDFFTKPLQGAQFRKFRNIILNNNDIDPEINESQDHRSVLGNNNDITRLDKILTHENENPTDEIPTDGWTIVQKRRNKKVDSP